MDYGIVHANKAHSELLEKISRVAESSAEILITGPSGVGKELYAAYAHAKSPRAKKPFVTVSNFQTDYELTGNGKSQIRVQKSRLYGCLSTDLNFYKDRITELGDRASQSWRHGDFP